MTKSIFSIVVMAGVAYFAGTTQMNPGIHPDGPTTATNRKTEDMTNLISIVEIPTNDFSRAVSFYQEILAVSIEEVEMEGMQMGLFPGDGNTVSVVLIKGTEYKPSGDGTIVYLNAGEDLQISLDKIEPSGGKVIVPKTEISPEMGFFALFTDTEGNKLGLHSAH